MARDAVGQRLDLVVPFGCSGPAEEGSNAALRWSYDGKNQALRVHIAPVDWSAADWSLDQAKALSIEGFWIPRPWSSSEECPSTVQTISRDIAPIVLPGQTLAVAQFLKNDAKPAPPSYDIVKRIAVSDLDTSKGFLIRLRGRIDRIPGSDGALRCVQPAGSEQHPICIVSASIEEVRIENTATKTVLATWTLDGLHGPSAD